MALSINGNITFEEDWLQEDCHWRLNRYFAIRWEVSDLQEPPSIVYYLRKKDNNLVRVFPSTTTSSTKANITIFYAQINLDAVLAELSDATKLIAQLTVSSTMENKELSYDLTTFVPMLPPTASTALSISLVTDNPGEVKCSWTQPEESNDTNEARGYCIEIFHSPEGSPVFTRLNNLRWRDTEGRYTESSTPYIEKIPDDDIPEISTPDVEGEIATFVFNTPNSELYIRNPEVTEFYFMPKQLGINPGDRYLFKVYPYNVYGTYWTFDEDGNLDLPMSGTLLTNAGTEHQGKVSKGIVRVKTDNGWVEGQVWVMTDNGWVQAEAVYAMQDGNWHEAT